MKFAGIGDRVSDVFSLTCLRATRQTKSRAFGADEDEKKKFFCRLSYTSIDGSGDDADDASDGRRQRRRRRPGEEGEINT